MFFVLVPSDVLDKCNPSPCGTNAICNDGICTCIEEHQGDPYVGCRPECVLSIDCPKDKACVRNKCVDPCENTCAVTAVCEVINHVPMCSCPQGKTGNAFYSCNPILGIDCAYYKYNFLIFSFCPYKIFLNDTCLKSI